MAEGASPAVTELLHAWQRGDATALDRLMVVVYDELHRIAARHLRHEQPGHTFAPTDLVSEAFLRLAGGEAPALHDREHFFAIAARNMRQILVDHARKRSTAKRGDGTRAITLDEELVGSGRSDELLALDEALAALAEVDQRKARAIELHYFGGMTRDEIGVVLGVHGNTVASDLRLGAAWIHRYLSRA